MKSAWAVACTGLVVLGAAWPAFVSGDEPAPALSEADCRTLLALHGELLAEEVDADADARLAVEEAIIDRPGCGETQGRLLDARSGEGVNPFDPREPAGFGLPEDAEEDQ
ncbi:hypothetical protein [Aquisalimonas asiatica]|uniref:Uncharacterized protein n=1 Tax=Aquisalimonas asiatica TaxID=406100 RepID=A0A1H8TG31_9GAMM|nr:hypothetical protein [Aquisalimonas asiatica]SEO89574.1 hypothetical protein SAMN04488052_104129 [Aquisalimonas asiatica]